MVIAEAEDVVDIAVIGGGPAGMFAAFYGGCGKRRLKSLKVYLMDSFNRMSEAHRQLIENESLPKWRG